MSPHDDEAVKEYILPQRANRRLILTPGMKWGIAITFILLCIIFLAKLHFLSEFSGESLHWIIRFFNIQEEQAIIKPGYIGNIMFYYLAIPIQTPSRLLSLIVASAVFLIMGILPKLFKSKSSKSLPKVILINLLLSALGFFALLFLIVPGSFTHNPDSLGRLFSTVSHCILLGGSMLFWILCIPIPAGFFRRLGYTLLFELTLIVLFFIKYAFYIILCTYGTYLIVPYIILILLSLVDIIYLNCIFSLMTSSVSAKVNKDIRLWQKT